MSFGWSAGDIAAALTLLFNLVKALDSTDGAAGNYQESVNFLRDLIRTIDGLNTLTALKVHPTYGDEITQQVSLIRGPVEQFIDAVRKYEPSLGKSAAQGHHRHVWKKLQWHFAKEDKVLALKAKIDQHMRIIDTLIHRLTLDVVLKVQETLPQQMETIFTDVLSPNILGLLRESLGSSVCTEVALKLQGSFDLHPYPDFESDIQKIKTHLTDSHITQQRIESCLKVDTLQKISSKKTRARGQTHIVGGRRPRGRKIAGNNRHRIIPNTQHAEFQRKGYGSTTEESLREVYYSVLLYVGQFLRNLFLALSRLLEPSRAITPLLLANYNITFLDAYGSPPRTLSYEIFRNYKIFHTFIREEFKNLPGSSLVRRGQYQPMSLHHNQRLSGRNWANFVSPGATVSMAVIHRSPIIGDNEDSSICPDKKCFGMWKRLEEPAWVECHMCMKVVFSSAHETEPDIHSRYAENGAGLPNRFLAIDRTSKIPTSQASSVGRHEDQLSELEQDYLTASRNYNHNKTHDIAYVKTKFHKAQRGNEWLLHRLGAAIADRRTFLAYRRESNFISSTPMTAYGELDLADEEISSDLSDILQRSHTASPRLHASWASMPGSPSVDGLDHFRCPLCQKNYRIMKHAQWVNHVFSDLRTYICTSKHCTHRAFSNRRHWFDHELRYHRRHWTCKICKTSSVACLADFDSTSQDYAEHFEYHHPNNPMDPWEIERFIEDRGPQSTFSAKDCPLCDELRTDEGDDGHTWVSGERFEEYLGHHMEQLAHISVQHWGKASPWPRRSPNDLKSFCFNCANARSECSKTKPCSGREKRTGMRQCIYQEDIEASHWNLVNQIQDLQAKCPTTENIMCSLPPGTGKVKVDQIIEALRCGEQLDKVVATLTKEDDAEVLGRRSQWV